MDELLKDTPFTGVSGKFIEDIDECMDSYKTAREKHIAERGVELKTWKENDVPKTRPYAVIIANRLDVYATETTSISTKLHSINLNESVERAIATIGSLEFIPEAPLVKPIPIYSSEGWNKKLGPKIEQKVQELQKKYRIKD